MDKTILITGASRGIGAACALLAGRRGYTVCVNYRENADAATRVVNAIEGAGGRAFAVAADVADEDDVVRLFAEVDARCGRLDALVNNAGILARQTRVEHMDAARINRILATNVTGSFLCAREAVRRMSTRHGGSGGAIVNVSSRAAVLGSANEYVDYAASKAAVDTLTIGLAREVAGEGIRVNGVRPGPILTDIHEVHGGYDAARAIGATGPLGRAGEPAEIAEAVLWLLSPGASYIHGAIVDATGGL